MKAMFQGKILKTTRTDSGHINVELDLKGKVNEEVPTAKDASLSLTLQLKSLVADKIKLGSTITVMLTDEEVPRE